MSNYQKLLDKYKDIWLIGSITGLLNWDLSVKMPVHGFPIRTAQQLLLNKMQKKAFQSKTFAYLLQAAEQEDLTPLQRRNVNLIRKKFKRQSLLPSKLQQDLQAASMKTEKAWQEAKDKNNFSIVLPELSKLVDLSRIEADLYANEFGGSRYDNLLDIYDEGSKEADISAIFSTVGKWISNNLDRVIEQQKNLSYPSSLAMEQSKQQEIVKKIVELFAFSPSFSRADTSSHPFCTGYKGDIRFTVRYLEDDHLSSVMAAIHEMGHGLFTNNIPQELLMTPAGELTNMSIHESQSLINEYHLARGKKFSEHYCKNICDSFSADLIYNSLNKVQRSFLRVDADEFTYPLHVIHRFNLESKIIVGTLDVKDLPSAWNQEFNRLFSITPPNDKLGCLQDIHWYWGAFGYYPSYCMGALIAAQLASQFTSSQEKFPEHLKEFHTWLHDNIHINANLYSTNDLLLKVTGKNYLLMHLFNI